MKFKTATRDLIVGILYIALGIGILLFVSFNTMGIKFRFGPLGYILCAAFVIYGLYAIFLRSRLRKGNKNFQEDESGDLENSSSSEEEED